MVHSHQMEFQPPRKMAHSVDGSDSPGRYCSSMAASLPIPGVTSARNNLSDVLATLPLVVLAAVLVWLAFARGGFEEDVTGSPQTNTGATGSPPVATTVPAQSLVPAQPLVASSSPPFLHIVVFPPERVAEVTALLAAESNLRAALGEGRREAAVIDAADAPEAERIATFIIADFGSLPGVRLNAIVLR